MQTPILNCVLYIDDDEVTGFIVKSLLEDLQIAKRIVILSDAVDALEFLTTCIPELILVDMRMPGMDGIEFIKKICQLPESNRIQIVGTSSYFSSADYKQLNKIGIQLIHKPLTTEKVLSCLESKKIS